MVMIIILNKNVIFITALLWGSAPTWGGQRTKMGRLSGYGLFIFDPRPHTHEVVELLVIKAIRCLIGRSTGCLSSFKKG